MKHLGDITKISGFNAPVVDCVIGGSPCQDLSVAGKCAGLGGERSKLFYEQIRIIKEMREKDVRNNCKSGVAVRPRYMVWENVPGAFSSNRGEDFRTVLEETAKVADKDAVIPRPDGGKWSTSGCIMGNGWSIAWRVLDAQFWGVPQRRRRIALVADFGGQSAPEILFVRKSVCGDSEQSREERKAASGETERSIGASDYDDNGIIYAVYENHSQDSRYKLLGKISETVTAKYGTGGNNQPLVISLDRASYNSGKNAQYDSTVRRLTPLECERLQGYPDGWTDIGEWTDSNGKKRHTSDSSRFKALGNSIAIPPCKWVLKRLCACYERDATMASLFDGIGGFPYIWEQINGRGTCLWASEIEEFPMAVTIRRFGDEG